MYSSHTKYTKEINNHVYIQLILNTRERNDDAIKQIYIAPQCTTSVSEYQTSTEINRISPGINCQHNQSLVHTTLNAQSNTYYCKSTVSPIGMNTHQSQRDSKPISRETRSNILNLIRVLTSRLQNQIRRITVLPYLINKPSII